MSVARGWWGRVATPTGRGCVREGRVRVRRARLRTHGEPVDACVAVRRAVLRAGLATARGTSRIDLHAPIPRILDLVGARVGIHRREGVSLRLLSAAPRHAVGCRVRPRPRVQWVEALDDAPQTGSPVAGEYNPGQSLAERQGLVVDRQAHLPALEDTAAAC